VTDPVDLSDDAVMTVIGTGTSLEGDRWSLVTDVGDDDPVIWLEVETPRGHHSKGGYGSPPLEPGMRLGTYTGHDDVGPDQIILRVTDDVSVVTLTLSDGRREQLTLYSDPTHPGSGSRRWSIHGTWTSTGSTCRPLRESHCPIACNHRW
jgi:hypothetical protein